MVKVMNRTTASPNDTKKQRKKQAKREAKAMLRLETARKDVHKSEQRVAKAQAQLEASRTRLHNLETEMAERPSTQPAVATGQDASAAQTSSDNYAHISSPADQLAYQPPVEGRTDIAQDQEEAASPMHNPTAVPAPTGGEATPWPPEETREEVVEAEQEEMQADDTAQSTGSSTTRHNYFSEGEQETLPLEQHGSDVI